MGGFFAADLKPPPRWSHEGGGGSAGGAAGRRGQPVAWWRTWSDKEGRKKKAPAEWGKKKPLLIHNYGHRYCDRYISFRSNRYNASIASSIKQSKKKSKSKRGTSHYPSRSRTTQTTCRSAQGAGQKEPRSPSHREVW